MEYIAVVKEEGAEPVEIELEENLSVSLAMLNAEFGSGIAGLSYRNPSTGLRRLLRTDGTHVNPPRSGWLEDVKYIIKRRVNQPTSEDTVKVTETAAQPASAKEETVTETGVKEEKVTAVSSGLFLFLSFSSKNSLIN